MLWERILSNLVPDFSRIKELIKVMNFSLFTNYEIKTVYEESNIC